MDALGVGRWPEVSALLDELLDLEAEERGARLAALHRTDPELAAEALALLSREEVVEREGFLAESSLGLAEAGLAGLAIGSYTLERLIGQGGMGAVWLAHRSDGRFEGKAAVKLLHLSLVARGGAGRFRREGNVLARLAHPNIARLLDAGVARGQPYLIIEHVEGEPIDAFCDARALGVEARLRLFLGVVDAVAHAHDKLVLHRDLKPSNILVTLAGEPKLLDFGIAKIVEEEERAAPATELTRQGGRAFTPRYAAPEQLEGGEARTATDVYGLGVVLYGLLTGGHPTAPADATPVEQLRATLEAEPLRASEAARRAGAEAASRRGTTPAGLVWRLRGDLDNILARALQRSAEARYPTAHALAVDLRRHLADEPIAARPPGFRYRMGKAMRRHRLAFAAAAVVAVTLLAGLAGVAWEAVMARRQRDRALGALEQSEVVTEFMNLMITEAAASDAPLTIPQLLEHSEALVESSLGRNPRGQAAALKVLADFYGSFGDHSRALPLLERAIALLPPGAEPSLRANLVCTRAFSISRLGRGEEARRVLADELSRVSGDRAAELECLLVEPFLSPGPEERRALARRMAALVDGEARDPTADPGQLAQLQGALAFLEYQDGDDAAADRSYRAATARLREIGREGGPYGIALHNNWGMELMAAGDSEHALALYDELLSWTSRARGGGAPPNFLALNRARALEAVGRYPEALAAYQRMRGWYDPASDPPFAAASRLGEAAVLLETGDAEGAQRALAEADGSGAIGPASPGAATRLLLGARLAAASGKAEEAARGADAAVQALAGADHPALLRFQAILLRASLALSATRLADARRDAEAALDLARRLRGTNATSSLVGRARVLLARIDLAGGRPDDARSGFGAAVEELAASVDPAHPDLRLARQGAERPRSAP